MPKKVELAINSNSRGTKMGMLTGKKILITGVISNKSIAAGIAEAMHREGAELAFTYQTEKFRDRVSDIAAEWNSNFLIPCDVSSDEQIQACFDTIKSQWGHLDGIVHSIAFAPSDQLDGDFVDVVNREGFRIAHDVSSYSFAALAKAGYPLMEGRKAAMVTLSYLGSERAIPNYNVMGLAKASLEANVRYLAASLGPKGIRVNGISAGPVKTLAASGIKHFKKMLSYNAKVSPLRQNIETIDVGNVAAFLCSELSQGMTGEILYVDSGFSKVSMTDLLVEE